MIAKTLKCSWDTMDALYGALIRLKQNEMMDAWNTQLAAYRRSEGIIILWLTNHRPMVSATAITINASPIWTNMEVENTRFRFSLFPFPNSNVRNLPTDEDKELENMENIVTKPPTTFCMP